MGVSEHLHTARITTACFAGAKTLVTASADCAVAVWNVAMSSDEIDLQLRGLLCGHSKPICALAVCSALSTILSVSTDGNAILWDLHRREMLRCFQAAGPSKVGADLNIGER